MNSDLSKWYEGYGRHSFYASIKYNPKGFIASAAGLIKGLVPESFDVHIRLTDDIETAALIPSNPKVIVLAAYLAETDPDVAKSKLPKGLLDCGDIYDRVAAALGAIVHEVMHIKYSPNDIRQAIAMAMKFFSLDKMGETVCFKPLINIVEDIYIEDRAVSEYSKIAWMIQAAWSYWLPQPSSWSGEQPKVKEDVFAALNWLASIKNPKNAILSTPLKEKLYSMLDDAKYLDFVHDRVMLASEIEKLLVSELEDVDEIELPENEKCNNPGNNSDDSEDAESKSENESGGSSTDSYGTYGKASQEVIDKLIEAIESGEDFGEPHENAEIDVLSQPSIVDSSAKVKIEFIDPALIENKGSWSPSVDSRWEKLEKIAYAISMGKPVDYIKTRRGSKIGDLSRIATDGKVFNKPIGNTSKQGRTSMPSIKEFIILVDCSGSMLSGGKLDRALSATVGATSAIVKSRHQVSAYGFTGDCSYGFSKFSDSVVLFTLFKDKDSLDLMIDRVKSIRDNRTTYNNYDGYSIDAVVKEFKSNGNKNLIVISDGSPAANGYGGIAAIEHTKNIVAEARKKGINVICISIDKSAIRTNDMIYGEGFNIHNDDPNAIDLVIEKLI